MSCCGESTTHGRSQQTMLGYDLAGPPTLLRLATEWRIDVLFRPAGPGAGGADLLAVWRVRGRGTPWPTTSGPPTADARATRNPAPLPAHLHRPAPGDGAGPAVAHAPNAVAASLVRAPVEPATATGPGGVSTLVAARVTQMVTAAR